MLIISVVVMMYTIDSALNHIWKINTPRHIVRRFFVYLALLIFGPLAISFSLFVSAYVVSLPLINMLSGSMVNNAVFNWLPFIVLWTAFTMLYKWVPDCKVRWLHAFSGATFAVFLFEIAKSGFALYISYFQTYEVLYGALAAIPLLLIWIYLIWLIVLIGAETACYMRVTDE
jgi:membrane protein